MSGEKLSITGVTQGNLRLTLPPNFPDLRQTQKQKMKFGTNLASLFHFPETVYDELCRCPQIPYPSPE